MGLKDLHRYLPGASHKEVIAAIAVPKTIAALHPDGDAAARRGLRHNDPEPGNLPSRRSEPRISIHLETLLELGDSENLALGDEHRSVGRHPAACPWSL